MEEIDINAIDIVNIGVDSTDMDVDIDIDTHGFRHR